MKYRFFSALNTWVSEIALGTWGLDHSKWGQHDSKEVRMAHCAAHELGVNFIDTAAAYGDAESIIGNNLKYLKINDFIIATKIAPLVTKLYPVRIEQAFPKTHIIESTHTSLRNLNRDYIDLQQLHIWDPNWVTQLEWLEALLSLKQSGKIRSIGVSIYDHAPDTVMELVKLGLIDSVQLHYNIFDQSPSDFLFNLCLQNQVSVIVRSPLYEGVLSGHYNLNSKFEENDWRLNFFAGGHWEECNERVDHLKEKFPTSKSDFAGFSLKFALSHPAVTTVAVGMRSVKHVFNNCRASSDFLLSPSLLKQLREHSWMAP